MPVPPAFRLHNLSGFEKLGCNAAHSSQPTRRAYFSDAKGPHWKAFPQLCRCNGRWER